jgi:hypothetical protein
MIEGNYGCIFSACLQPHEASTELEEASTELEEASSTSRDAPTLFLDGPKRKEWCLWSCLFPWTAASNQPLLDETLSCFPSTRPSSMESNSLQESESSSNNCRAIVVYQPPASSDRRTALSRGPMIARVHKRFVGACCSFPKSGSITSSAWTSTMAFLEEYVLWLVSNPHAFSSQDEYKYFATGDETSACSTSKELSIETHALQEGESAMENSQAIVVYKRPASSDRRTALSRGPIEQVHKRLAAASCSLPRSGSITSSAWTCTMAFLEEFVLWLVSNPHASSSQDEYKYLATGDETSACATSTELSIETHALQEGKSAVIDEDYQSVPTAVPGKKPPGMYKIHWSLNRKTQYIKYKVHPRVQVVSPSVDSSSSRAHSRTSAASQALLPCSTISENGLLKQLIVPVMRQQPPTLSQYLDSTSSMGGKHDRHDRKDLSPKRKRARSDSSQLTHTTCETSTVSLDTSSSSMSHPEEEEEMSISCGSDSCCDSTSTQAASCAGCTACSLKQELLEQKDEEIASLKQVLYKLAMESDWASNIVQAHRSEQESKNNNNNKSNQKMPTTFRMSQALAASSGPPLIGSSKEITNGTLGHRVRHYLIHVAGRSAYYSGPIDDQGRAHGSGCARFENGELYVGLLQLGSLTRGTLYSKSGQVLCHAQC